jgi:hypothetical protein
MLNQQPKDKYEVVQANVQREQAHQKTIQEKLDRLDKTFSYYFI